MFEHQLLPRASNTSTDAISPELFTFRLYHYTPSLPAAAVSVVVFTILTGIHTWRMHKAGSVYFIPFTIGGLCMYKCTRHSLRVSPIYVGKY